MAAVAGVALAVVLQIIGQMTMGFSIDYLGRIVVAGACVGFLIGVVIGPRGAKEAGNG